MILSEKNNYITKEIEKKYTKEKESFFKKIFNFMIDLIVGITVAELCIFGYIKYQNYTHEAMINAYKREINEYAASIDVSAYSDLDVFMKVMDDMWNGIDAYGNPKYDLKEYAGMDLMAGNGKGVCRNMADDVARKLNAINPEYKARTLTVELDPTKKIRVAGITTKVELANQNTIITIANKGNDYVEDPNATVLVTNEELPVNSENIIDILRTIGRQFSSDTLGNHRVVIVTLPNSNTQLMLDPTNPGIGVYQDGKIYSFNEVYEKDQMYKSKMIGEISVFLNIKETLSGYFNSFSNTREYTMSELEDEFGVEAQNYSLEKVRMIKNDNVVLSKGEGNSAVK